VATESSESSETHQPERKRRKRRDSDAEINVDGLQEMARHLVELRERASTANKHTDPHYAEVERGTIEVVAVGTLTHEELAPLLDELREQFFIVRTESWHMVPPMAGGPDVGVVITLITDALSNDLVKLYLVHVLAKWAEKDSETFRRKLAEALRRGKTPRGYRLILPGTFVCGRLRFYFDEELSQDELTERFNAMQALVSTLAPEQIAGERPGPGEYGLYWDKRSKSWAGEICLADDTGESMVIGRKEIRWR
jgi:hypothetical protein